jgi:hemolysin activation/secretion protein
MQQQTVLLASLAAAFTVLSGTALGQTQADIAAQQLQRQQQREKAQSDKAEEQRPDVRLPRAASTGQTSYPADETPCFPIRHIELGGDDAAQFAWALRAADDAIGLCLGSGGINAVLAKVQNALVAPHDLTSGRLALVLNIVAENLAEGKNDI